MKVTAAAVAAAHHSLLAQGGGGRYAVACNNSGMDWITGTSRHTLEALQPPAAGDARAWVLPDTAALTGGRLADVLPQLYTGRDWALARASAVHLADGATTITGVQLPAVAPPPPVPCCPALVPTGQAARWAAPTLQPRACLACLVHPQCLCATCWVTLRR